MRTRLFILLLCLFPPACPQAEEPWIRSGPDGQPEVHLYFFWSLTCPHCTQAQPAIAAIPLARPWVKLHALELTQHPDNIQLYEAMTGALGAVATSVPAFLFCGEMQVGWDGDDTTGERIRQGLDICRAWAMGTQPSRETPAPAAAPLLELPVIGVLDPTRLSLPVLTGLLAGLDAFNPCAFFVLLFLLSLMVHQRNPTRILVIGGIFVSISGLMYFAFMGAWLSVFQLLGHLEGVTLAAGALAMLVGTLNIKDFFSLHQGPSLSIPESRRPDIFRRARAILSADSMPAMVAATVLLALAANFYELLCTAGFPLVYTRLLTLADLTPAGRFAYLAAYNLIYVMPLGVIVILFARNLGARKLSEREGRLLKLLSGIMMLGLGALLLLAPALLNQVGSAILLMALALGITWLAAKLTRRS